MAPRLQQKWLCSSLAWSPARPKKRTSDYLAKESRSATSRVERLSGRLTALFAVPGLTALLLARREPTDRGDDVLFGARISVVQIDIGRTINFYRNSPHEMILKY